MNVKSIKLDHKEAENRLYLLFDIILINIAKLLNLYRFEITSVRY